MTRFRPARDEAVTEVIGYVLSFALSAVFLLVALHVFDAARGNTEHVVAGVELRAVADRIAGRITELGLVSQEFTNATMTTTLAVPQTLAGKLYKIQATAATVTVSTLDDGLSAQATTYNTDVLTAILVTTANGAVDSSNAVVRLEYEEVGTTRHIRILGE